MPIITITTDLGYRDPYLAMVKGILYSKIPNVTIVDLACQVNKHNHKDGVFNLMSGLAYFPENTIHLFAIKYLGDKKSLANRDIDNTRYLMTKYKNQYIVCPDNGVFHSMDKTFNEPVYQLYFENHIKHSFYLRDVFTDIAEKIVNQVPLSEYCTPIDDYCKIFYNECYATPSNLQGQVLYVDDFGNLITNITKTEFDKHIGNKKFDISLPGGHVDKLFQTYDDVKVGDMVCFFNSMGYLEIALYGDEAGKIVLNRMMFEKYKIDKVIIEIND